MHSTVSKMKKIFHFDFLQKLGKTLLVVVAVMPAAGLSISFGAILQLFTPEGQIINSLGYVLAQMGWVVINNLHILFAIAIGGSWAKEKAGGAFAATVAFLFLNVITGSVFGVTADVLATQGATTHTLFGTEILVSDYFTSAVGIPALNMGVFVGIIAGFLGAAAYNKYYNFRKLPDALSFFAGKRFVPFVVILWSTFAALILCVVWPTVQQGINHFGQWLANSKDSGPFIAPFVYGTLERLLLPFGLHHMLTMPMNYTTVGGTYQLLTDSSAGIAGSIVQGQDPIWFAWIQDLVNLKQQGNMEAYNYLLETVTPSRFKVGQMIGSSGLVIGFALGMYKNVDKDKKVLYASIFTSVALATFITGITEPVEYMFLFAAPVLYIVYAVLQGFAFGLADFINLRLQALGNIELVSRAPMAISAGLIGDIINFVVCVIIFFLIGFLVSYFMIKKLDLATPGRKGNYMDIKNLKTSDNKQKKDIDVDTGKYM